jgi:hypothetical protein
VLVFLRPVAADLLLRECPDDQEQGDAILVGVDQLGHAVRQTNIGNAADADLARKPRIAVRHCDNHTLLHALDERNSGFIDKCVEDGRVSCRWIEEVILDAGRFELLQIELSARAGYVANGSRRSGRSVRAHRRECLRDGVGGCCAQPGRAQIRHQRAARNALIKILLDQFLHERLLPSDRSFAAFPFDGKYRRRVHGTAAPIINGQGSRRYRVGQ